MLVRGTPTPTVLALPACKRRSLLVSSLALCLPPLPALAEEAARTEERWRVSGRATLQGAGETSELDVPEASALYLTLRPKGGNLGPVAAKRIPLSGRVQFPVAWELSDADALPDAPSFDSWSSLQLMVSARLDTDGVAATRDPDDLVGRSVAEPVERGAWRSVTLPLQGRGLAGRLVTQRDRK